jgi:hypothetical protein
MTRRIEILLESRGVRAVAELLDEEAPKTCEAVWQGLPQSGPIWHAKFANNEIFIQPGSPVPAEVREQCNATGLVDLALFYGRNNYLHGPEGHMPGNLFATITDGLKPLAAACQEIWRHGGSSETMSIRRLEE